jgi:hypothetical protein
MVHVIVERRFDEPQIFDELQAKEESFAWCLEQHGVRFIRSYFSKDRKRMICEYEAPDAESVRRAQRTASLPFEHIWTATLFDWNDP